jgi:hypothetical protein
MRRSHVLFTLILVGSSSIATRAQQPPFDPAAAMLAQKPPSRPRRKGSPH